jgi:hypothetical protein
MKIFMSTQVDERFQNHALTKFEWKERLLSFELFSGKAKGKNRFRYYMSIANNKETTNESQN